MAALQIKWKTGDGYIYLSQGSGEFDATIAVSSDANSSNASRSQDVTFTTADEQDEDKESVEVVLNIRQYGNSASNNYDGCWSNTPAQEYTRTINGGNASSTYDSSTDTAVNCGKAQ